MKNFGDILKKAQEMQSKMAEMQEKVSQIEVTGSAGGGLVQIIMTAKGNVRKISIDSSLKEDIPMLEDLLVAAFNDAQKKSEDILSEEMSEMKSGFKLPF